mmetsp:Transcript_40314/g.97359  ORF Transcript_40314/g.97359 Transcript_40314/m.97359 type:complete len:652 (+) Transcript_40314:201-2156(+)
MQRFLFLSFPHLILLLLLSISIIIIDGGRAVEAKQPLEAVEEFHDLLASSGSLLQEISSSSLVTLSYHPEEEEEDLEEEVAEGVTLGDQKCYNGTFFVLDYNLPGGLVSAFSARETLYCFLTGECDFAGSAFAQAAAENCAAANGLLVVSDLYVCRSEFGAQGVGANENIRLANLPLCVDPIHCPSEHGTTTFQKILKTAYALGLGGDASFEGTFTGTCAPIEIDWKLESAPFEPIYAKVGDQIIFNYHDSTDNVYLYPDGDGCNDANAIQVGKNGGDAGASYTVTSSDVGKTIVFASTIGSRCEEGQLLKVIVGQNAPRPSRVIEVNWIIPGPGQGYANQTARVGDTVKFTYSTAHNVYKHPSNTCDEKHSLLVGDSTGPGFYRFIANDTGTTVTFACDVGSHCEEGGQILHFQVEGEARDGIMEPSTPEIPTMTPAPPSPAPTMLPADDFAAGIANGDYDVILDVRSETEWNAGHIEGATLAESLAAYGNMGHTGATPSDLAGCEFCNIAVYCRSGARARSAIQVLLNNGFQGEIYNGQGTSQWTNAGYPLVTGDSVVPPCTTSGQDSCAAAAAPPTESPGGGGGDGNGGDGEDTIPDRKQAKPDNKNGFKFERTRTGTDFTQIGIRGGGGGRRMRLTNLMPEEMEESI